MRNISSTVLALCSLQYVNMCFEVFIRLYLSAVLYLNISYDLLEYRKSTTHIPKFHSWRTSLFWGNISNLDTQQNLYLSSTSYFTRLWQKGEFSSSFSFKQKTTVVLPRNTPDQKTLMKILWAKRQLTLELENLYMNVFRNLNPLSGFKDLWELYFRRKPSLITLLLLWMH